MSEERMLPRVDPPESAMQAGMSAALVFDSSLPGPFSQPGPPRPVTWIYDFDPATGQSRATFGGEVVAGIISTPGSGVSAFNGRTGSVTLETADLTALDALFNPSPALAGVPTAPTAAASTSTTQVATCQFVMQAVAAGAGVVSFNGRQGAITLTTADITSAGGAPSVSPALTGNPTAPTPNATDASSSIATTQYVQNVVAGQAVVSFNGRRGVVNLTLGDVTGVGGAPIASPAFTGSPTSTNPPPGDATTRIATTEFVTNAIVGAATGVVSFNTRQGAVTLLASDISAAGGALLAGPVFTGQPEAPTPPANDASTRLATTQFVETAITSMAPIVTSFNTRTGAVSLQLADVTAVGGAPLASPTFTGTPQTTAPAPGDNSSRIPTTGWVDAAIAAIPANVASFNGRTGAVTLTGGDITGAGGALAANVLPLTGGTLTGALNVSSGNLAVSSGNVSGNFLIATGNNIIVGPQVASSALLNTPAANQLVIQTQAGANLTTLSVQATTTNFNGTVTIPAGVNGSFNFPSTGGTEGALGNIGGTQAGIVYTPGQSAMWRASDAAWFWGNSGLPMLLSATGNLTIVGTLTQGSDASLKENIEPSKYGLAEILLLEPKCYNRVGDEQEEHGLIAQEVEEILPHCVKEHEQKWGDVEAETIKGIDYSQVIATLICAVKELNAKVEELERK